MTELQKASPGEARAMSGRRALAWMIAGAWPLVAWPMCWSAVGRGPSITWWASLPDAVLLPFLLAVTMTDIGRRKVPNWATYPALLWALAFNAMSTAGVLSAAGAEALGCVGLFDSLAGLFACALPLFLIYSGSGGGAGDVKLAAAIGAWLGASRGLNALVLAWIVGGVFVVARAVWSIGPLALIGGLCRAVLSLILPRWVAAPSGDQERFLYRRVPLAPFFAAGTCMVLFGVEVPW